MFVPIAYGMPGSEMVSEYQRGEIVGERSVEAHTRFDSSTRCSRLIQVRLKPAVVSGRGSMGVAPRGASRPNLEPA